MDRRRPSALIAPLLGAMAVLCMLLGLAAPTRASAAADEPAVGQGEGGDDDPTREPNAETTTAVEESRDYEPENERDACTAVGATPAFASAAACPGVERATTGTDAAPPLSVAPAVHGARGPPAK